MGVFLSLRFSTCPQGCLPHARGGVSGLSAVPCIRPLSSPRTWGCFCWHFSSICCLSVFPTHVGVFLAIKDPPNHASCLPHARGGVSLLSSFFSTIALSSPRTWGCFSAEKIAKEEYKVFPTHVGVFPLNHYQIAGGLCLPHARGGVSRLVRLHGISRMSSPRTWGCFPVATLDIDYYASSPRTWGCF